MPPMSNHPIKQDMQKSHPETPSGTFAFTVDALKVDEVFSPLFVPPFSSV